MDGIQIKTLSGPVIDLAGEHIENLQAAIRGQIYLPTSTGYDEARSVWNGMIDKRPALVVRCTGTADVVDVVKFANQHQLLSSVKGGGHNAAGSATNDGGLMIDLSLMRAVHVDPSARRARVQGGATWAELDRETQLFGLATPGGLVSTTGVAGLTLGGGLGFLRRKYGLSCDNLTSVDIVTADGNVLTANEKTNSDLFWAVRGGGGNFGIVTSFEFKLHPVGPTVMAVTVMHSIEKATKLLPLWRDFMAAAPDEISSSAAMTSIPAIPGLPPELQGKPVLVINAMYSGSVEDGERLLQPLRDFDTPLLDFSGPNSYVNVQSGSDGLVPARELNYYMKGVYFDRLDDEVIATLLEYAASRPSQRTAMGIWHMGGAMDRVPVDATAFGVRGIPYMLEITTIWAGHENNDANVKWSRDCWAAMQPYSSGGQYVNFQGLGEEGELLVKEAYAANYPRLAAIKRKYDPTNLFRVNQNIKPAAEMA